MADNNYANWEAYTNSRFKPLPFKDQSADMGFFVRPIIGLTAREETDPIVPAGGTQEQARFMPPLSLPKEDDLQVDNPNVNPNFQPAQQTQQVQQAQTVAPQQLTPPAPAQPIADNNYTQAEIQNMKLYGMPQPPAVVTHPTVGMPVQQYTPNAVTYQIPDTTQDAYKQVMDNYYTQLNDAIPQQRAYWQKAHNFANSELDRQALIRQREEEQYQEAKARSERAYVKEKEGDGSSWWNPVGILTGLGEVFYGSRKYNPQTRQYELTAPTSWKEATQNIVRNIATAGSGLSFGYGKGGLRTAYNAAMPEFYRAKREQNQRAPHAAWEAAQDQLLAQSIDPHPRQPLRPWTFDTPLPTVDHPFTNFMVDKAQKEAAFRSVADQLEREREMFGYTPEQYNERARELFGRPLDIQEEADKLRAELKSINYPEDKIEAAVTQLVLNKHGLMSDEQKELYLDRYTRGRGKSSTTNSQTAKNNMALWRATVPKIAASSNPEDLKDAWQELVVAIEDPAYAEYLNPTVDSKGKKVAGLQELAAMLWDKITNKKSTPEELSSLVEKYQENAENKSTVSRSENEKIVKEVAKTLDKSAAKTSVPRSNGPGQSWIDIVGSVNQNATHAKLISRIIDGDNGLATEYKKHKEEYDKHPKLLEQEIMRRLAEELSEPELAALTMMNDNKPFFPWQASRKAMLATALLMLYRKADPQKAKQYEKALSEETQSRIDAPRRRREDRARLARTQIASPPQDINSVRMPTLNFLNYPAVE